jgi:glutaredoxin 2
MPDEDIMKVYAVVDSCADKTAKEQEPIKPAETYREIAFRKITTRMAEVYSAKNHDYGNSFAKLRERYPTSILIRLADKLNRLDTLLMGDAAKVKDESIDDTLLDLANYAVMELVERRLER